MSGVPLTIACRAVTLGGVLVAACFSATPAYAQTDDRTPSQLLAAGDLEGAERVLRERDDAEGLSSGDRFCLAMTQYLGAAEHFSAAMYAHGAYSGRTLILPLPAVFGDPNPRGQRISYTQMRAVMQRLIDDLDRTEQTLARIDGEDWQFAMQVDTVRLDLDGDGDVTGEETLYQLLAQSAGGRHAVSRFGQEIAFDQADVHWFRSQCLFYSAITEFLLAYDWRPFWDYGAPYLFPSTDSPHQDWVAGRPVDTIDAVAMLHLMRWELVETERIGRCADKFQRMVAQMNITFDRLEAETDDDREWFPSPNQTGALPVFRMTQDSLKRWRRLLQTTDQLLRGEQLMPLARTFMAESPRSSRGINVKAFFDDPGTFDLVLMMQGSGVADYMQEGTIDYAFWSELIEGIVAGDLDNFGFNLF